MIALPQSSKLRSLAFGMLALLAASGCQDELTTPADCPALCPGGQLQVQESVFTAIAGDSSFLGYVSTGLGTSLRISNGLPVSEDRAVALFLPRPDSIAVDGTQRAITSIDSVIFTLTLQARDSTITGLKLFLYKLPTDVDSTTTFAEVEPELIPANLIDSISVPDSVHSGLLRTVISGADTAKVSTDSTGRFAIGIRIGAAAATGVRIASIAATGAPSFISHVHVDISDTTKQRQAVTRFPSFTTFVSQNLPVVGGDLLTVGGAPSSRSLIRFDLPTTVRDSVTILRATLELTPDAPILGLPNDPGLLQTFGIVGDLGAKSPLLNSSQFIGFSQIESGTADTVEVDITSLVRLWQGLNGLPNAVMLSVAPEASSFTQPSFRSTRSASGGAPRIRITFYQKFPFERF